MKKLIDYKIKKDLTNIICALGANQASMTNNLSKNHIPRKIMKERLKTNEFLLSRLNELKTELLELVDKIDDEKKRLD